ncbi:metallophosphoesterase family protein [Lignipirellula cremea]|uniref:Cyclic 3',5'-adenosine monophosphate phosphodiesterase n=1 Tax=Lignipirellula cremea TaxID=2528010 RepID=A0A518DRU8_9BACT|nr:metallophosphoesterase [Lignipirellula cremea]QDU94562.1 cyclic 3',5'-adenosine monophosphate phosphodiesterase [Lignipirellula cremea]
MFTILHISDLHFGPPFMEHVGEALLRIAPRLNPDVVVASGDFTQRATAEQFAQARAFLDRMPGPPVVVTPGNHDVPLYRVYERFTDPYKFYREHISPDLQGVHHFDDAVIVHINSTSPRRTIVNGRITERQLDFVEQSVADAPPGAMKIVVAHHHFAPAPDYERDTTVQGARKAIDRFVNAGVELILGGHLHRAYIGNSLDSYPGAHRERGLIIVQSGTSTSRRGRAREREKNSFNLLWFSEGMLYVTHYMYFHEIEEFGPVSRHAFPRPGQVFTEEGEQLAILQSKQAEDLA